MYIKSSQDPRRHAQIGRPEIERGTGLELARTRDLNFGRYGRGFADIRDEIKTSAQDRLSTRKTAIFVVPKVVRTWAPLADAPAPRDCCQRLIFQQRGSHSR